MNRLINTWRSLVERLEGLGQWLAPLFLRLLLFWEFFESGREKLNGQNWFADIQGDFPFPFNMIPASISWTMATWAELLFAFALLLGLCTRFAAFSLMIVTAVAVAAVHLPMEWQMLSDLAKGYAITNNGFGNYKLGLIFVVMLLPLIFRGAGKLSIDALLASRLDPDAVKPWADSYAWGIGALIFGLPFAMLIPGFGLILIGLGVAILLATRLMQR
ncbi:MAG: DoxX family protein [Lysobacteraceae bacterium]